MSVLIKNMTMPECCAMCPMCHRNFDWRKPRLACYALSAWCIADEDRLEKCPLVELPEKHGRLIDADLLKNEYPHDTDWDYPVNTNCYVSESIDNAPTVVEAEGE